MTKKEWKCKRKLLPANYVKLVMQLLDKDGVVSNYTQVYDVIRGKNKNTILTFKVWEKISLVQKEHQALIKKLKALK
ncbi:hypothetical protein FAM09_24675 [Niastella caeni]|uniref:Uncharacterized protein n=1 Tax=Niastella caeni TaxID=2569763 RepID=A0A4S8HGQ9_9BACT|nr:hypothetical protein [Niastella caeni]THU34217.1 hypothetical protein FAM09_24675 [Niastella caeni]